MPENLLLTHWLAEILNAAHIMYYQTVIDVKYSTPDSTGEYGILECQTVIDVKYSTPDNWRAIIIRFKSVVRRLVSTDVHIKMSSSDTRASLACQYPLLVLPPDHLGCPLPDRHDTGL